MPKKDKGPVDGGPSFLDLAADGEDGGGGGITAGFINTAILPDAWLLNREFCLFLRWLVLLLLAEFVKMELGVLALFELYIDPVVGINISEWTADVLGDIVDCVV